jgi:ATP synthase protein I
LTLVEGIKDNARNSKVHVHNSSENIAGMDESTITISQAFKKAARWQIITTIAVGMASLLLVGVNAAVSSLLGGAAALIGGYVGVSTVRRQENRSAGGLLIDLLKAEAMKVAVISLQLLIIFKFYNELVPLALIGGLAAAVLVSGAGLQAVGNDNK